jgi:thioredoxin-like negative regulator of GroEL
MTFQCAADDFQFEEIVDLRDFPVKFPAPGLSQLNSSKVNEKYILTIALKVSSFFTLKTLTFTLWVIIYIIAFIMKRNNIFRHFRRVLAAITFVLVALVLATPTIPAAFKKVAIGEPPPPFTLRGIDGGDHSSGDLLAGKVTVVLFWATWSPRSLETLEDLASLSESLGPGSFQTVAINAEHPEITRGDMEKIKAAVKDAGSQALVLVDDGLTVFSDYGTMALPSMLVVDKRGKVTFAMAGYPTTMRSDLTEAVKLALGLVTEKEIEVVEEYVPKNHALMYYNMGKRLYQKGQEEKAEAQLLQSVERDPDFIRPRLLLGVYYKKTGRGEEALKEFEKVKELDPRDKEAGYQVAAVTLRSERFSEAELLFQELLEEYPEREEFALGLALAHKYQGHEGEYRKVRDRTADLYPAEARYYYELGGIAEAADDLSEAVVLYRGALEKAQIAVFEDESRLLQPGR